MNAEVAASAATVGLVSRWADLACARLAEARAVIDGLNVFPVADADTGTNLSLTLEAGRTAVREAAPAALDGGLSALAQGAFRGARGNSGVIVAQVIKAVAGYAWRDDRPPGADAVAAALARAVDAAYESVGEPVEGTILTVARAARDAAARARDEGCDAPHALREAADASWLALADTVAELPALAAAGVVDAGGAGLCLLLDSVSELASGTRPKRPPLDSLAGQADRPHTTAAPTVGGPVFEVMYLLDAPAAAAAALRELLVGAGDSVVVAGDDGCWHVHVHSGDAGAVIEAGLATGRLSQVRVSPLEEHPEALQTADGVRVTRSADTQAPARGLVAFAAGPGLAELFRRAGAVVIAERASRCPPERLLAAIGQTGAVEVVVLPNEPGGAEAAEQAAAAARRSGQRIAVVPSTAQVQGLAAAAVHQPQRRFEDDVVAMTAAAGHTRHGAVTIAARDAMTSAGPCRRGDTLGIVGGDFALVGGTLAQAAVAVVERLLAGGGELVTLLSGEGGDETLVAAVIERLDATRPDVELVVYEGGQPRYPLLIGVE